MKQPTRLTRDHVVSVTGEIDAARITDVIETGATLAELIEAWTWMTEDDYLGGELQREMTGTVGAVYEILKRDLPAAEDERE